MRLPRKIKKHCKTLLKERNIGIDYSSEKMKSVVTILYRGSGKDPLTSIIGYNYFPKCLDYLAMLPVKPLSEYDKEVINDTINSLKDYVLDNQLTLLKKKEENKI